MSIYSRSKPLNQMRSFFFQYLWRVRFQRYLILLTSALFLDKAWYKIWEWKKIFFIKILNV